MLKQASWENSQQKVNLNAGDWGEKQTSKWELCYESRTFYCDLTRKMMCEHKCHHDFQKVPFSHIILDTKSYFTGKNAGREKVNRPQNKHFQNST